MESIVYLRKKAETLRKKKEYCDALEFYNKIWILQSKTKDKWDGLFYALCLNKCKKYKEALEVCREIYRNNKDFQNIKYQYAYAAYMLKIKNYNSKDDEYTLLKYANGIIYLVENIEKNNFLYQLTVLKVMEYYESNLQWEEVLDWSKKLSCEEYSDNNILLENENGRKLNLPSNREKWYLKTTKALEKIGRLEECKKLTQEALNRYPENIWFKRRMAMLEGNIGNIDKAIEALKEIVLFKHDWYLYKDIGSLFFKAGNYKEAARYLSETCLITKRHPKPQNLWEVYYLLGYSLNKINEEEMAKKHILLALILRRNAGWKIPKKLHEIASQLSINIDDHEEIKYKSSQMINELKPFWQGIRFIDKPPIEGKIKVILKNRISGFIAGNDGKDYYFKLSDIKGEKDSFRKNTHVRFHIIDSYDRIKKKKSLKAINIEKI